MNVRVHVTATLFSVGAWELCRSEASCTCSAVNYRQRSKETKVDSYRTTPSCKYSPSTCTCTCYCHVACDACVVHYISIIKLWVTMYVVKYWLTVVLAINQVAHNVWALAVACTSTVFLLLQEGVTFSYYRYDPETDRWKTLRPMKSARALVGCAVFRGKIYVIGLLETTFHVSHKTTLILSLDGTVCRLLNSICQCVLFSCCSIAFNILFTYMYCID